MTLDWQELTRLLLGKKFVIERVRLLEQDIAIEGNFALPPLACLSAEDQIFVTAFLRCHGSIKQMEQYFGVSYPTIKNRLSRLGSQLDFADIDVKPAQEDVLTRLERGVITVEEALEELAQ